MNATNMANVYKNQQIMTATPEELTLMLYNGAIRFISESIQELERHNLAKSHAANIRAQDIIREFICTLDMRYDIAKSLYSLYEYIQFRLIQANVKKDKIQLEEARKLLTELRDTWAEAMKIARGSRAMAR